MHSCSSQFHVIDGFSASHPHNNHITTHNDKDCMPFLPGWNDALGPALLHPGPPLHGCSKETFLGSDAGPACRFSSRRRGSISAWISRHGPWPSPGSSFPLDPQDTSAMHATLNDFFYISQARFNLWTVPCLQVTSRSGASAVLQSRRRSWGWTGAWQDLARWASKCSCSCTHRVLIVHVPLRLCLVMKSIWIWIYLSLSRHAGLKIPLPLRPGPSSCTRTLWKRCWATRP